MEWYMAIIYGIIQGFTEFLPVSSSGHLAIAQGVFGIDSPESYFTFDILLHIGTLFAVLIVFRKDISALIFAFFTMLSKIVRGKFSPKTCSPYEKLVLYVIIATLPLICMVFLSDYIKVIYAYTKIIGAILIFNGVMLYVSDRIGKENVSVQNAKPWHAIVVGICQTIAVIPGISRSGSTITGGLFCGFERPFAVKFSFILSIPAILGATVLEVPEMLNTAVSRSDILPYALGMLSAMIFGFMAMKLLVYISKKASFTIFSYYCVIVGILAIIFG